MERDRTSSNYSNDIIETYVQRLLAWEDTLTAETLNDLAAEAGLGPTEIAAVQEKAKAHLKRGLNYLEHDCVDDAIEELTQAAALAPLELDILKNLSQAYAQRYRQQQSAIDKEKCIATAKRCLEIAPDDRDAASLIKSVKTTDSQAYDVASTDNSSSVGLLANIFKHRFVVTCLVGAGLAASVFGYNTISDQFSAINGTSEIGDRPQIHRPQIRNSKNNNPATQAEVDIPVIFEHPGITLEPRLSRLSNYEDSSFNILQGVVKNDSDQEIDSLVLKVEYLDKDGNILDANSEEAVEDYTPPLRPGDSHAFDLIEELNPALVTLRLSIVTLDQLPAASSYTPARPIDYSWAFSQPLHLQFELGARAETVSTSYKTHVDADWAVVNTGETAIRELKFKVDFYDDGDRITRSKEIYAVLGGYAALLPSEIRPIRVFEEVPENYTRYTVEVLEAG